MSRHLLAPQQPERVPAADGGIGKSGDTGHGDSGKQCDKQESDHFCETFNGRHNRVDGMWTTGGKLRIGCGSRYETMFAFCSARSRVICASPNQRRGELKVAIGAR
ncbi:hypothetical protein [Parafrankia sp. BMG5.11]|uniref:hypothetical protein n=1 Tax=Parafrankia sp. BMG5.11 TaxID=222540 RepID=UPI001039B1C5|nr:hypothetical protein [Parafrankia sp. BMG5.11]TCJ39036.1 hypothetical protein E0504_12175 [Parafrankia sp. BMG5.11]